MIDTDKLLEWLDANAGRKAALVGAIYQGLADRVRRGDFDVEVEVDR